MPAPSSGSIRVGPGGRSPGPAIPDTQPGRVTSTATSGSSRPDATGRHRPSPAHRRPATAGPWLPAGRVTPTPAGPPVGAVRPARDARSLRALTTRDAGPQVRARPAATTSPARVRAGARSSADASATGTGGHELRDRVPPTVGVTRGSFNDLSRRVCSPADMAGQIGQKGIASERSWRDSSHGGPVRPEKRAAEARQARERGPPAGPGRTTPAPGRVGPRTGCDGPANGVRRAPPSPRRGTRFGPRGPP